MNAPDVIAQPITMEQAITFLGQDPVANVELLGAIRYDRAVQCIGALRGDVLVGVLVFAQEEDDDAWAVRFEAVDRETLFPLIDACPPGVQRIAVHRPWMVRPLASAFRLIPEQRSETVFCAHSVISPPSSPAVRLLTVADASVMEASATMGGGRGFLVALAQGFRPFGIIVENRVVAHAFAANATDWTEEVMSVWTAPRRRGQGLATAVVATAAADILRREKIAIYVAAVTNLASQRVAIKTGFQRAYDTTTYRVRRR